MTPVALWLPYEVDDLDHAREFYTAGLGLSVVDGWDRDGERGVVLGAGAAFVELVSPGRSGAAPPAFEYRTESDVDTLARRVGGGTPRRHPRGHYGFDTSGPAETRLMVWTERT